MFLSLAYYTAISGNPSAGSSTSLGGGGGVDGLLWGGVALFWAAEPLIWD